MKVEATLPVGSGTVSACSAAATSGSASQPASRTRRCFSMSIKVEVHPRPNFVASGGSVMKGR